MTNYLEKLILSLSMIFLEKLRIELFSEKDCQEELSIWNIIVMNFGDLISVKFINVYFEKFTKKEKSLAWILLLVLDKSFYDFLIKFYNLEIHK